MTSNLFDSLSDVSTKFSRHLSKEYDLINDLIGKSFKKIAKEERSHDESMESLDNKLKKANYAYDKKIRSSAPGSNNAQNVHEQFVPLLSQLTEDITRNKNNHSMNMALRREGIVKEAARTLTCLAEIEFRKNCELVKKLGGYIGTVLAIQALLGPSPATSGNNGNIGTAGKGEKNGLGEMPNYWPKGLPDLDELGRIQPHQQSQQGGHIHPLASVQSSPLLDQPGGQERQYHDIGTAGIGGRSLDDLLPPKAPFTSSDTISERSRKGSDACSATSGTSASSQRGQQAPPPSTTRSYSSISNGSSNSSQQAVPTRFLSLQEINDAPIDRYGTIAVNERGNELNSGKNGMRSVSHPLQEEARRAARATSAAMDHDATVTMRNVHTKPSVDTSFFPSTRTSSTVQDEKPTRALSQEKKVDSPTYREHNVARTPALQPALSYSPSQSGKVGYFGERKHDRRITEEEEESETLNLRRRDGEESHVKMPAGFIMEESSPEQYIQQHHRHRRNPITTSPELLAHATASGMHCSSASGGSHGDSPTLSIGTAANTSTTSYSQNLNESYTNSPAHESVNDKGNHHQAESNEKVRRDHDGELVDKPKEGGGGAQLERSLSIESTASEKSFVARMKALYAEERESRRISSFNKASHDTSPSSHNNAGDTSAHSNPSETRPSGRRVSTIAQKWEEKSLNGKTVAASSFVAGLGTGRPMHNHAHRASMPVIPTMTHTSSSPHQTGSHKPNMQRYSSAGAGAAASGPANQAHPSVCGCEDCTREGYANRETRGGAMQSRRVSMPPGGP